MKKKTKVVIAASLLAIIGAGGVTVSTTAALFSKSETSNVHISVGSLNIKFYMTSLKYDQIVEGGKQEYTVDFATDPTYSQYYTEGKGVDLAKWGSAVFTVSNAFPGMGGKYTYLVENYSKVAVNATITDILSGKFSDETVMTESDLAMFTVTNDWVGTKELAASDGTTPTSASANCTFTFDATAGSKYEGCTFDIDSTLTATQKLLEYVE